MFQSTVVGVQKVAESEVSKYGIVSYREELANDVFRVDDMVEKPTPEAAPSNSAILGRYILTSEIFDILSQQKPGAGGENSIDRCIKAAFRTTAGFSLSLYRESI